jgi:CRP-like cAMP-binding protein
MNETNSKNPETKLFTPTEILFHQGSVGGELFFLKKGAVELVVRESREGKEAVVAVVHAPAVLGTMTFLEDERRSATGRCLTEVEVSIVTRKLKEKLLADTPEWLRVLLKDLTLSLRNLNEKYVQVKSKCGILETRLEKLKPKAKQKSKS